MKDYKELELEYESVIQGLYSNDQLSEYEYEALKDLLNRFKMFKGYVLSSGIPA